MKLYLHAAALHLRLSTFFDNPATDTHREDLLALYMSTTKFLETALALELPTPASSVPISILSYAPFYIFQMLLACGFILLKISNSFFAAFVDMEYTKQLFNRTIYAIRGISVTNNDLPERLAEVLAQVWKTGVLSRGSRNGEPDASVQLKVRCRLSMSLVYDSVWRWREDFQIRSQGKPIESTYSPGTDHDLK